MSRMLLGICSLLVHLILYVLVTSQLQPGLRRVHDVRGDMQREWPVLYLITRAEMAHAAEATSSVAAPQVLKDRLAQPASTQLAVKAPAAPAVVDAGTGNPTTNHHLSFRSGVAAEVTAAVRSAEPVASSPQRSLLDTDASRAVIVHAAKNKPAHRLAAEDVGVRHRTVDSKLGTAMEGAVMQECLKGDENQSGGAGLLALPVILYRAATGQCAR